MHVAAVERDGHLQVVARVGLVECRGLHARPADVRRVVRAQLVGARARTVRRARRVEPAPRRLLIGRERLDLHLGVRHEAEPVVHGHRGPVHRGACVGQHVVLGAERVLRIGAQRLQQRLHVVGAEALPGDALHLLLDARHLPQPRLVDLLRIQVQRGVEAHRGAVARLPVGVGGHAHRLRVPGTRRRGRRGSAPWPGRIRSTTSARTSALKLSSSAREAGA